MAISPQLPQHSKDVVERHRLAFPVLSDAGNRVAKQFGLVFRLADDLQQVYGTFNIDLPKVNGDDSWTLPMPARFVIDRSGIIRAAEASPDYTHRPEPADTVEVLKTL